MKNNHTLLKRLAAISLVVVMCLSSLAVLAPSASAAPVAESNELIGEYVTFHQDYSEIGMVPNNVFTMNPASPFIVNGVTLNYNQIDGSIVYSSVKGESDPAGRVYVSGLTPAVIVNRTIDLEFTWDQESPYLIVQSDTAYRILLHMSEACPEVRIGSYTGGAIDITELTIEDWPQFADYDGSGGSIRAKLGIMSNGVDRTVSVYIDDRLVTTASMPIPSKTDEGDLIYTSPTLSIDHLIGSGAPEGSRCTTRIYSITETVPRYSHLTPLADPRVHGWGLDGPHPVDTIQNGVALVHQHGWTGTIWADVRLVAPGTDRHAYVMYLLDSGWELGIHYSKKLTSLPLSEALDLMYSEYRQIEEWFGRSPIIWCSQGNQDNVTHAKYAAESLGMIWRNGYNLYGRMGNFRAVIEDRWDGGLEVLSKHGAIGVLYTHETDLEPTYDPANGIGWDHFQEWVTNHADNGVRMVGWYEYWANAMNTHYTQISDLMVDDGKSMSFALDNIGGKSRVFVAAPWTEKVLDGDGNEVPFEAVDDGIIIEVEAGEYQIYSMSGLRQEQVDRAMSPLYAIILVVIVLAVLGGLFTMVGRLKF
jgi:hypothetical protein